MPCDSAEPVTPRCSAALAHVGACRAMPNVRAIAPATGRLGVLTPGMGAVASTFIAGVLSARQGLSVPMGSLSQLAHIRLGDRAEGRNPLIREFVPLASLDDLVFGGWDPISPNALEAARTSGVLEERTSPRSRPSSRVSSPWTPCSTSAGSSASTGTA
jgi:hypothetical protein